MSVGPEHFVEALSSGTGLSTGLHSEGGILASNSLEDRLFKQIEEIKSTERAAQRRLAKHLEGLRASADAQIARDRSRAPEIERELARIEEEAEELGKAMSELNADILRSYARGDSSRDIGKKMDRLHRGILESIPAFEGRYPFNRVFQPGFRPR